MTTSRNHTHRPSDGVMAHGHAQAGKKSIMPKACTDVARNVQRNHTLPNNDKRYGPSPTERPWPAGGHRNRYTLNGYTIVMALAAFLLFATTGTKQVNAQGLGLNNPTPDPSAILDLTATDRGLLVPRMTSTDRINITSPATGLLVYDTDLGAFYFYTGSVWSNLSLDTDWTVSGNYVYNINDSIGIGTATPTERLEVSGNIKVSGDLTVSGNDIFFGDGASINNTTSYLQLRDNDNQIRMWIGDDGTGGHTWFNLGDVSSNYYFRDYLSNAMVTFTGAGDVGIGTTTPTTQLEVVGGGKFSGNLNLLSYSTDHPTSGVVGVAWEDDYWRFRFGGTSTPLGIRIDNYDVVGIELKRGGSAYFAGNVGIGTSTPAEALDVAGTAQMTGFKLTTTPTAGYVLSSDAAGVGTWTDPTTISDGDWDMSGNYVYNTADSIGIGTATPGAKLDVAGQIIVGGDAISPTNFMTLIVGERSAVDNYSTIRLAPQTTAGRGWSVDVFDDGTTGQYFQLYDQVNSATRFLIDNNGNIGIGDATPDGKLEVRQTGTADIFNLYDGATNVFTVEDGGNVGIGTTSPNSLLHLKLSNTSINAFRMETSLATSEDWYMYMNASDDLIFRNDGLDAVTFEKNTGSVGIGDATPDGKLEVRQTGTTDIFNLYDNTINVLTVLDGGNVGIGDATPDGKLEVRQIGAADIFNLYDNTVNVLSVLDGGDMWAGSPTTFYVDSSASRVGIGTTSPVSALHVHSGGTSTALMRITTSISGSTSTDGLRIGVIGSSNEASIMNFENGVLVFGTNNTSRMLISSTGNVGIGTTTPDGKIEVRQTAAADIFNLYDNTTNVFSVLDGGDMWAGSPTTFYVDSSAGSVGIGTTTPTALLEISALGAGTDLLKFNIDRAWKFRSVGTGAASKLDLMCLSNDKRFRIMAGDGSTRIAVFFASNTPTSNRVWLVPDGGLVGIGTPSPSHSLHIVTSGTANDALFIDVNEGVGEDFIVDDDVADVTLRPAADGEGYLGTTNFTWQQVNGVTKNFSIQHPTKSGWDLKHSVLEGPEISVFYRGEAQLVNGEATITLPGYFEALTLDGNRTVLLTPIAETGKPISSLAASYVIGGKFTVQMIGSLNPEQKFFWEVKAVRADVPPLDVEIENVSEYDKLREEQEEQHKALYYNSESNE